MWDEYDKGRTLWLGAVIVILVILAASFTSTLVGLHRGQEAERAHDKSRDVTLGGGFNAVAVRPLGAMGGCTLWQVQPKGERTAYVTTCPTSPEK